MQTRVLSLLLAQKLWAPKCQYLPDNQINRAFGAANSPMDPMPTYLNYLMLAAAMQLVPNRLKTLEVPELPTAHRVNQILVQ